MLVNNALLLTSNTNVVNKTIWRYLYYNISATQQGSGTYAYSASTTKDMRKIGSLSRIPYWDIEGTRYTLKTLQCNVGSRLRNNSSIWLIRDKTGSLHVPSALSTIRVTTLYNKRTLEFTENNSSLGAAYDCYNQAKFTASNTFDMRSMHDAGIYPELEFWPEPTGYYVKESVNAIINAIIKEDLHIFLKSGIVYSNKGQNYFQLSDFANLEPDGILCKLVKANLSSISWPMYNVYIENNNVILIDPDKPVFFSMHSVGGSN